MYDQIEKSLIGYPGEGQTVSPSPSGTIEVIGVAWASDDALEMVEVSTDGGETWGEAEFFGPVGAPTGWRQFRYVWQDPSSGEHTLISRTTDERGYTQPASISAPEDQLRASRTTSSRGTRAATPTTPTSPTASPSASMSEMAGVEPGQVAIVHLTGRIADGPEAGEVFETTDVDVALDEGIYHDYRDYKPLEFRVGEGHVLPGIDATVQDMRSGETRTVVLEPSDAYGKRDDDAVVTVSRSTLETRSETTADPGELVRSRTNDVGWIVDVDEETATIDFNHELAGERVEFEIRLLEVHGGRSNKQASSERGREA